MNSLTFLQMLTNIREESNSPNIRLHPIIYKKPLHLNNCNLAKISLGEMLRGIYTIATQTTLLRGQSRRNVAMN